MPSAAVISTALPDRPRPYIGQHGESSHRRCAPRGRARGFCAECPPDRPVQMTICLRPELRGKRNLVVVIYCFPVDDLKKGGDVFRPPVLVFKIVGVFPDIQAPVVDNDPGPPAAK